MHWKRGREGQYSKKLTFEKDFGCMREHDPPPQLLWWHRPCLEVIFIEECVAYVVIIDQ